MKFRITLLLLIACLRLHAQQVSYPFSHLDVTNGLSHNEIRAIYKDAKGFMWFGTISGLNRYDGYKFKIYRHDNKDSTSVNSNNINRIIEGPENKIWLETNRGFDIYDPQKEVFNHNASAYLQALGMDTLLRGITKDRNNNYWFVTAKALYKYNGTGKKAQQVYVANDKDVPIISDLARDGNGNFWLVSNTGTIEKLDGQTRRVVYKDTFIKDLKKSNTLNYRLFIDAQNELWIFPLNDVQGVYYVKPSTGQILHFKKDDAQYHLNNDLVTGILQNSDGLIWVGTDHGGINLINKNTLAVTYLLNDPSDDKSISQSVIKAMYRDDKGIIWLGTHKKGINYYHENIIKFAEYKQQLTNANSLGFDDINRFAEDAKGNLWIGTNGGGLNYYNRKTGVFTKYVHDASNTNSLCNNVIVGLCVDSEQKLWIGTYYGGLDCFDGKTFTHYKYDPLKPGSIADNRVYSIYEDSNKDLWVGMLWGSLNRFDRKTKTFVHYKGKSSTDSIPAKDVTTIAEDKEKNLWLGTPDGIFVFDKRTKKFTHLIHPNLVQYNIIYLMNDSEDRMWIATRDGLMMYNKKTKSFFTYTTANGLPDNNIMGIIEDNQHNIWATTANGISKGVVQTNAAGKVIVNFTNFNELDGLQGKSFNERAILKTTNGELVFGGTNGFNLVNPANIKSVTYAAPIVFTDLQVFDKSVVPGEKINGNIILNKSITNAKEVSLRYDENIFTIEFASLDYLNTAKNKYAYKLIGFNKNWVITDGDNRKITYTNLDPGSYTFTVKTLNNDGSFNAEEASMHITVLPPFWRTTWAYLLYAIAFIGALIFARWFEMRRTKLKFALDHERKEAQRMHELDLMKTKFFTNVSHELRTPLSLIISPLDKMLRNAQDETQKNQYHVIQRNAKRLLSMVNQLLDFRKLEMQEIKLNLSNADIIQFIKEASYSFTDIAEKKHIHFSFSSYTDHLFTSFDSDKIERILFNLLSNAFKFTHENGSVTVSVDSINDTGDEQLLEINVQDTGIGIAQEKQDKIFDRFFQNEVPGNLINQGNGIGLSITKEFVKLHNGIIKVKSEPGKGSCFSVLLPVTKLAEDKVLKIVDSTNEDANEVTTIDEEIKTEAAPALQEISSTKQTVLLIEDNEDFRFYLKDNLREFYNIAEASNGKEGWQKTLQLHPALVVSDIMMPEVSGIELCKKIKSDARTLHIPIILLTARSTDEFVKEGYKIGANDYITKPFNFEILLSRINNLLTQQSTLSKALKKQIDAKATVVEVVSQDEKFIQQALQIIEKNIDNPSFSVEEWSREMFISRVALYRKILTITGKSPVEFIRSIRLQRAAQLLEESQLTIAEVAYKVGFNNSKYLAKYFKAAYGVLPSSYVADKKNAAAKS